MKRSRLQAIYTIKELAEASDISERTLWHWVSIERIKPLRVGKLVFVSINALRDQMPDVWASMCTKNGFEPSACEACGAPIRP